MRVRELIDQLSTVDPDLFVQARLHPGYLSPVAWAVRANGMGGVMAEIGVEPGWQADFVQDHSRVEYIDG